MGTWLNQWLHTNIANEKKLIQLSRCVFEYREDELWKKLQNVAHFIHRYSIYFYRFLPKIRRINYLHLALMIRLVQFTFANDRANDIIQMQNIRCQNNWIFALLLASFREIEINKWMWVLFALKQQQCVRVCSLWALCVLFARLQWQNCHMKTELQRSGYHHCGCFRWSSFHFPFYRALRNAF